VRAGDDDHPAYSDRQISEAMAARVINAIAAHPQIWEQCAIINTIPQGFNPLPSTYKAAN
jgi:phospholipase C